MCSDSGNPSYYTANTLLLNIASLVPQGYLIMNAEKKQAEFRHRRFGISSTVCPECNKPLLRFLDIDTLDPRIGLTQLPFDYIPLYYCFSCSLCRGYLYYKFDNRGEISTHWSVIDEIEFNYYENVIDASTISETGIVLIKLTEHEQRYLINQDDNSLESKCRVYLLDHLQTLHTNLLGGYKKTTYHNWIDYSFSCQQCADDMLYLASFNTTTPDGREICGDYNTPELVYAYCRKCNIVGAMHTNYL